MEPEDHGKDEDMDRDEAENEEVETAEEETEEPGTEDETDEEESEEGEDEESEEESEEDDEESEEEGDEEESDEEEDEDGEGDEKSRYGKRAQKRIGKLTGKVKDLERDLEAARKELDEAKKLTGDDGKVLLEVARKSGILPNLLTAEVAKGLATLEKRRETLEAYEEWLDDESHTELETEDGETVPRAKIRRRVRMLREEIEELDAKYAGRRAEAQRTVKELLELGRAARKAGWRPGRKAEPASRPKKKETVKPGKGGGKVVRPKRRQAGRIDWSDVGDDASAEAMILADLQKED